MKKGILLQYTLLVLMAGMLLPQTAMGFSCTTRSIDISVNAATVFADTSKGSKIFTLPTGGIFNCNGEANSSHQDAMRIETVSYHANLTNFSRTLTVTSGRSVTNTGTSGVGTAVNVASSGLCTWPDGVCTSSGYNMASRNSKSLSLTLEGAPVAMTSGTILAVANIGRRSFSSGAFNQEYYTVRYVLQGDIVLQAYTCNVTYYDNAVTLATVRTDDIVSRGTGRYTRTSKLFNLHLDCDDNTDVTVKFSGDAMTGTGTDSVLKNKIAGNENIGVQLLYNNTPLKLNENIPLITGASGSTPLAFDAYYYYKGGNIAGGKIKAQTEFTLTYK